MNDCCCSSPEFANEVTFAEFVCYILWQHTNKIQANHHWKEQYKSCQPCSVKYDSLVYYETMRDDAKHVLLRIADRPNITLVSRSEDTLQASSDDHLHLYDTVPVNNIRGLLNFYKNDYNIFGFQIQERIRSRLQK